MFNTLRPDSETQARMNSYFGLMDQFTRFEVQLIAKYNNVPFKWGVTSKQNIIQLMQGEGLDVPNKDTMDKYIEMHRAETRQGKTEKQEEELGIAKPVSKPEPSIREMSRKELINAAKAVGIKNPVGMKSVAIIEELERGQNTTSNDE